MYKKYKFSIYILLAALREYREKNQFNIHKFNLYITYCLMVMMITYIALYVGINQHIIATILLFFLIIISFQSVDFDNFISFCQNKNNKILMAYPMKYSYILLVHSIKFLLLHLFIVNLGVLPILFIFYYFLDHPIGFILKFSLLINIICSFTYFLGWASWIHKWQEVKLEEKKIGKFISIILLGTVSIVLIHLVRTYKYNINEILNRVMVINQMKFNFFDNHSYWMIVVIICLLSFFSLLYIKKYLIRIYDFYIIEGNQNSESTERITMLEKILNNKRWFNIFIKKEFYVIIRNKNIYNEIVRKVKYSILLMSLVSIYLYLYPIKINFYIATIFITLGIMGYADKIIRSYLPVSAEGNMIVNYIQSHTNIKTIIQNKVNMLFLYRQLYIIGPLIYVASISKFNIIDILYFLIVWFIMSYTSANIKIYSVSVNSKFLTSEDFFKKMTVSGIVKYIMFESSYYYLTFLIVTLCNLYIPNIFAIIIGLIWISIIYNIAVYILQGHGRKFYGEFERYI